jgi:hypothetical protein
MVVLITDHHAVSARLLFFHGEVKADQWIAAPVEKSCNQSVMLCESKGFAARQN